MDRPELDRIRAVSKDALAASVQAVRLPGIADAELRGAALSSTQLRRAATRLTRHGHDAIRVTAEVELFLRISNTDVLSSIQRPEFLVMINASGNDFSAVANNEEDWELAWERGMAPIKQAALQGIRRDVWKMDETLAEDSYTFRAAMVLLTSELVGPYVDRVATFVGYPRAIVQVIGARLHEAKIWEGDQVRCEDWFDPRKGGTAFQLDVMVAEGEIVRRWSQERKAYAYSLASNRPVSQLVV